MQGTVIHDILVRGVDVGPAHTCLSMHVAVVAASLAVWVGLVDVLAMFLGALHLQFPKMVSAGLPATVTTLF